MLLGTPLSMMSGMSPGLNLANTGFTAALVFVKASQKKGDMAFLCVSPFLIGLVVQEIDKQIDRSIFNNLFEIEVFPAPEGEDNTMQKLLLLITNNYTCVRASKTK